MTLPILISEEFLTQSDFQRVLFEVSTLAFTPVDGHSEAQLINPGAWARRLDGFVKRYAKDSLSADADEISTVLATHHAKGQSCAEHVDQYEREGAGSTLHRSVIAVLMVSPAAKGGNLVISNPSKTTTLQLPLKSNELVLFPADCWHSVLEVTEGTRRSVVRWYAQSSGDRFRSEPLPPPTS